VEQLQEAYKQNNVILFVGSGVSKNLGLPTFSELIDEVARLLHYDSDIFKSLSNYQSLVEYYKIKKKSIGDTLVLNSKPNYLNANQNINLINKFIEIYENNFNNR
jgi:NAD-dependent SIR2 family protein deacetylase